MTVAQAQYTTGFEDASKSAYASGTVTFSGIDWNFTEAVTGSLANDFFNGTQSTRMRGYGTSAITMLQDKANGIGNISFVYRRYGTEAQEAWVVEYSTDGGGTWTQAGAAFTPGAVSAPDFETFSADVNIDVPARIRVRREVQTGSSNRRMCIDDLVLTDFSNGGGFQLHDLSAADYTLNQWASAEAAGTYPASMLFQWSTDPGLVGFDRTAEGSADYNCGYDLVSRSRINGLGMNGFSFINTGSAQYDDCVSGAADEGRFVGSALLGLDMTGVTYARAEWNATTVLRNFRDYAVRLQYRIGDTGNFTDFDATTEFSAVGTADGDSQAFIFELPATLHNQPEVYLRWVYYQLENSPTGARPEIGIDNILVTASEIAAVNGCTDDQACNYDPFATNDDGSCLFIGLACDDNNNATINDIVNGDCLCEGTPVAIPNIIITELSYNPDDSAGFPDTSYEFLEIYNAGGSPVDLSGFYFTGVTFTFGAGSTIAPGEYAIVAVAPGSWADLTTNGAQVFGPYTGALSNSGELVSLFDSFGNVVSAVNFDDSAPWPSTPDGAGPTLELIDLSLDITLSTSWQASCGLNGTPAAPNSVYPCPTAPLIISELNYNPNDGAGFADTAFEFVEIYNPGPTSVDLENYSFSGITFVFPAGASIAVGEYIIVAVNPASYTGNGYQVFGPNTGALSNGGESIVLLDNNGVTVDDVFFDNNAPWPTLSNGFGPSLELSDLSSDNSDGANWQASCAYNGTPGAANSAQPCPSVATTIAAVQSDVDANGASLQAGQYVTLNGVVTGVYATPGLFAMQDGTGAWSGIWVQGTGAAQADDVSVSGWLTELNGVTLLVAQSVTVNQSAVALPAAEVLSTLDISQEQWEGVLLRSTGVVVSGDLGFGEFSFDDGSGLAYGDDLGYLAAPLVDGATYRVTGPNYFSFAAFKLEPRDANDVEKFGCTDDSFPNYDPTAVIDDGSCSLAPGCTDPAAVNYDPAAGVDDGSCIFSGCTDPTALNYDPQATVDDGSCFFTLPNIVINEIHYNPCVAQGNDDQWEFFELYNAETFTVDLSGYVISQGITYTFPAGASIAAGEYIIVTVNQANYVGNGYQVFQWTSGALSNGGEALTLVDALGNTIDSVTYGTGGPWPAAANGSCSSLELINTALDNSLAANWQAAFVNNGTPGAVNSTPPPASSFTIFEIQSDADVDGNSLLVGQSVTTQGIVTGVYPDANIFSMQDGTGPFSGIWVSGNAVALGDEVEVTGTVSELFGLTQITGVTNIAIQTQGNVLPANQPLATFGINEEQWEGVLVEITGPVSISDAGFGEWGVNDGSGAALIDDLGILVAPADLGVTYTVIGPNYYSFGNFKLQPRDGADVLRWGCTDNSFPNYDPLAVINDGSCANVAGCTDPLADNYDPAATVDDGSCVIFGCTDPTALNYNANATNDNGSCYFTLPNVVINEIHYNPCNWQGDDFTYEFFELYNAEAFTVDLSGFVISGSITFTFPAGSEMAAGEYIVLAFAAATYEGNGYQVYQWTSGNLGNTTGNITLADGFGNTIDTVGYQDSGAWPILADGDCPSLELIDATLDNTLGASWQSSFVLFGTPGAVNSQNIQGCTNPAACNYNADAISDDGSCDFVSCQGCTYPSASNYTPAATQDDGSCEFVDNCPADLNNDSIINSADLLLFLGAFGTTCN